MALIKCSECGKDVSDKATTCPNCGNPIKSSATDNKQTGSSLLKNPFFWIVIAIVAFFSYYAMTYKDNQLTKERAKELIEENTESYKKHLQEDREKTEKNIDIIRNGK